MNIKSKAFQREAVVGIQDDRFLLKPTKSARE